MIIIIIYLKCIRPQIQTWAESYQWLFKNVSILIAAMWDGVSVKIGWAVVSPHWLSDMAKSSCDFMSVWQLIK